MKRALTLEEARVELDRARKHEAELQAILATTHEAIVIVEASGSIAVANAAAEHIFGRAAGELLHVSLAALLSGSLDGALEGMLRDLGEAPGAHLPGRTIEAQGRRSDGVEFPLELSASAGRTEGHAFLACFIRDLSERKRGEAAHARQMELCELLLQAQSEAGDGVAITDGYRFLHVNEALAKLFGMTVDEVLALPSFMVMIAPEERGVIGNRYRERVQGLPMSPGLRETVIMTKDGRRVQIEYAVKNMREGDSMRMITVFHDITARRELHARLVLADRLASMGTLAAGMAHEINNPLAYVRVNLDAMSEMLSELNSKSSSTRLEELKEMVRDAQVGAERVGTIVRGLKTFSRSEEERRAAINLHNALEAAVKLTSNTIRQRGRVTKEYGELPLVEADEARLGQAFINLLINAAEALPEGEPEENEIGITTRTDSRWRAVIEVRDTGRGIARDVIDRIFDPFFTTKPIGSGAGLGLFICHGIVTSVGGEITVESELGKGTTFRIVLPPARVQTIAAPLEEVAPEGLVRRARILVIDDEPMIGASLQRLLRDHDVVVAGTAKEADELLLSAPEFDIIFCDVMMPVVSGPEFHERVCRRSPEQARRMVFMTGGAFCPSARAFLDQVPNDCIDKPFDLGKLRALLERILTGAS